MAMGTAKLTRTGQLTIPQEVRNNLGVGPGDEIEFVEEAGAFLIRKRVFHSPFDRYLGFLRDKEGQDPDQIVRDLRGHE